MVSVYFLKSLARFSIAASLFIALPEYLLHLGSTADASLAGKHYFTDDATGRTYYEPLSGCKLPPSQPFPAMLVSNVFKVAVFTILFGTLPDRFTAAANIFQAVGLKNDGKSMAPWWKRWMYVMLIVYQYVMIPISMVSTIYHFFSSMGPFGSFWNGYQCFGIMWTQGPWWFNVLFLFTKFLMISGALSSDKGFGAAEARLSDDDTPVCAVLHLKDSLLGQRTEAQLVLQKSSAYMSMFRDTLLPYFLLWLPTLTTHLLPGLVIFAPEIAIVVAIFMIIFAATAFDPEGNFIARKLLKALCFMCNDDDEPLFNTQRKADDDESILALAEKTGGLLYLPVLVGANIIAQVLVLQMTYFYAGEGYFGSMAVTWLERQMSIYLSALSASILGHLWSAADLLNEST